MCVGERQGGRDEARPYKASEEDSLERKTRRRGTGETRETPRRVWCDLTVFGGPIGAAPPRGQLQVGELPSRKRSRTWILLFGKQNNRGRKGNSLCL